MPRQFQRHLLSLEITLESSSGKHEARISDLSMDGCFIDTIINVAEGEIASFDLRLANDESIPLTGEVVYVMPRIGFGMRFTDLTDEKKNILEQIISTGGGDPYSKAD